MTDATGKSPVELTANIVSAYLSNNPTQASEIPNLISQVHAALLRVSTGRVEATPLEPAKPAVSVKKSMTPEYLVCLEDGKRFKSLKRHLRTQYNMTPEQYREKWGLPADYPMVAPNYARVRSNLAKNMGLGQSRKDGSHRHWWSAPHRTSRRDRRRRRPVFLHRDDFRARGNDGRNVEGHPKPPHARPHGRRRHRP